MDDDVKYLFVFYSKLHKRVGVVLFADLNKAGVLKYSMETAFRRSVLNLVIRDRVSIV